MKLLVENDDYRCIVEDSHSDHLLKLVNELSHWQITKDKVVTITIDSNHEENPELVKIITKDICETIKALKGIEYFDESIISIKFDKV